MKLQYLKSCPGILILLTCLLVYPAGAQDAGGGLNADELAKKLSNPVAALISVPVQGNVDFGGGPDGEGEKFTVNIQPVIPISVSEDWNLISRTVLPVIHQEDVAFDGSWSQSGLGDTVQSLFLSPKEPTDAGLIWGAGPVALLPTATEDVLGAEKLGLGPTAVFLFQKNGWTYGALVNHIWSVAGEDDRADVSATFLQPFLSRAVGMGGTATLNSESTYDWESDHWLIPVNAQYSRIFTLGSQILQWQVGGRVFAEAPAGAPDWGLRASLVMLFPK